MALFIMVLLMVLFFANIEAFFNMFLLGLVLFIVGSATMGAYNWALSVQVETAERLSALCECTDETISNQKEIVMNHHERKQQEEAYQLRLISEFASLVLAEGSHSVLNEMIRQNKEGWQEMEAYFDMVRQF